MKTSYPKEKITAVLLEGVHPHGAAMLEREGFKVRTFAKALEGAALEKAIADAHLVGIRSKTALTQEVLAKAPRLLAAGCFCIGTNQVDLACAASRGIAVFNSPFSNTRSVAELTIAEAVALHRRLVDKTREMHAGMWDKSAEGAHEVRGRTIGIVGYGHIGTQVSILAEAMGMRVMYFDIVPKLPLGNARACKSLNELLEQCDVLTLHVPATSRTKNMIGKAELARMKQGSYVINNARGSVVELGALAAALKSGKIAGAALDVFPEEPAGRGDPFESPVRGLPNVILTPHIGGSTEQAQESIADDVCTKLLRFVNVGTTTGAVNVPQVELPDQHTDDPKQSRRHRILHFHRNVPGVLSAIHRTIAELGANITAEYLQTDREYGYVVLDIDPSNAGEIVKRLKGLAETIRARVLY
ncbi:MAG: phosphoglycerate dehydrogenase [Phycisphaerales bacterium]|nr:phosphoglycerate dehydrogenase [Phycisphaerales bacterium]